MRGPDATQLRRAVRLALPLTAAVLVTSSAHAAPQGPATKRVCKPRIEWTALADSRVQAQRKAIDGWSAAAAGQHGDGFTKWGIAGIARVSCTLVLEGHRCRAAASPCRDLTELGGVPPAAKK